MVDRLDYKVMGLAILFLLCWMGYSPLACGGAVVWSDDFDDGNYDGWTICDNTVYNNGSEWSADNNYLQLDQGTWSSYYSLYWGIISHPSDVAYGTWSFDFKFDEAKVQSDTFASVEFISSNLDGDYMSDWRCYWIYFEAISTSEFEIKLRKNIATILDTYETPVPVTGWHHIDVTRTEAGLISVYHDGALIMEAVDTDIDTSELFVFSPQEGAMFDNIVVHDDIPLDIIPIVIIIASAVVIIAVVVIYLKRR
ncbi:MAG: hypothetical protein ACFFFD_11960 [Promethearchaeota archaeon]